MSRNTRKKIICMIEESRLIEFPQKGDIGFADAWDWVENGVIRFAQVSDCPETGPAFHRQRGSLRYIPHRALWIPWQ